MIGGESLASELNGKPISKKKIEWLGMKLWALALSGDIAAIKELLDRMEGKVSQPLGLNHSGEINAVLRFDYSNGNGNGNGGPK